MKHKEKEIVWLEVLVILQEITITVVLNLFSVWVDDSEYLGYIFRKMFHISLLNNLNKILIFSKKHTSTLTQRLFLNYSVLLVC